MQEVCAGSLSGKRWWLRDCEDTHTLTFSQKLGLSPLLARLLAIRGHSLDSAPLFLTPSLRHQLPDPSILKDMDRAVARVAQAIHDRENILIWGDYDVDGATSSALLCRFFRSIGVTAAVYIPNRSKEGYGPNAAGIQRFKEQGYTVMITVDCGTTAFEALENTGMDVIILDHHAPEAQLPAVYAVVNPHRLDEEVTTTQALGHLAAVGISFLFAIALNRALRKAGFYQITPEPQLMDLLDLVALGTVCDVMPLTGLNRTFVSQGLKVMAQRKNLGLRVLADRAGLNESPTPYHLGFVFGPRINAGGRVGDSFLGTRLLSTDNIEEADAIARKLEDYNQDRRRLETLALEQAMIQADPSATVLVVDHADWHEGIIGIVAGRLKERFHKPSAVIAWNKEGIGKGSARSVAGFDFGRFIHQAQREGHVLGGGGHAMAAGFSLTREQLPGFITYLESKVEGVDTTPSLLCDGYLELAALTPELMQDIDGFSPFGMGNPAPKFIFTDVMVHSYTLIKEAHIRCRLSQGAGSVDAIGFQLAGTAVGQVLMEGQRRPLRVVAVPKLDTWGGRTKVTLTVEDVAAA